MKSNLIARARELSRLKHQGLHLPDRASTPPLDWTRQKQWTYIEGACAIAAECRGLWPRLDGEFALAFEVARQEFRGSTEQ
ncbi:MAG TPA: hypothetical protein VK092_07050 [Deinococcales bacterium]|nr:hypothetical protein [Deinococcales bacterium]